VASRKDIIEHITGV